jgi:predicted enzyme related to lactoylglutathione lyase
MTTETKTAVGKFVWHEHRSADVERAKSFYTKLLGWGIEVWKPGEMDYGMIAAGGQMHGGFAAAQEGEPAHWLGLVAADDVDAAAGRAQAAGGTVVAGPFDIPEVGRMAVPADPQGAVLGLFKSFGEDPQNEGTFVWDELHTTDVEGAKRFYRQVTGWTSRDVEMGGGFTYTMFQRPSGDDAAGCMQVTEGEQAPPHWLAYIYTDDVDATVSTAISLGATTLVEASDIPNIGRFAIIQDPLGAVVGLFKPTAQ